MFDIALYFYVILHKYMVIFVFLVLYSIHCEIIFHFYPFSVDFRNVFHDVDSCIYGAHAHLFLWYALHDGKSAYKHANHHHYHNKCY